MLHPIISGILPTKFSKTGQSWWSHVKSFCLWSANFRSWKGDSGQETGSRHTGQAHMVLYSGSSARTGYRHRLSCTPSLSLRTEQICAICCNPGSAKQALQTPQTMLDEVVWCVSDPPQQARLDTPHAAAPFADVQGARYGARTLCAHMSLPTIHMLMSAYLSMVVSHRAHCCNKCMA